MKLLLALVLSISVLSAADKCRVLALHGKRDEARACYTQLTNSADSFNRANGYFGLLDYQRANESFRQADQEHPNSAEIKTAWGELYLSIARYNNASELFREAIKANPGYAPAYVGLSKLLAEDYSKDSEAVARQALERDPQFFPAHEMLAYLALENGAGHEAEEEAQKALAISNEALDAMAILASLDFLKGNGLALADNSPWMARLLKIDPYYGEAYLTAGHFLEINYRYTEAIAAFRKALDLNPDLAAARSQLGINLMRLGQTEEAQQQLARAYHSHYQSVETRNSLRFLDTVGQYDHIATKNYELVLNKSESALLRPYIEPELERAIAAYERKYKVALPKPVRLEVYPNHEDFVVRTIGLPGQGGLLGVTFGTVVAIDSPAARPAGDFSWADTMWHELCHVYAITGTHNLIPRWFSEGLAVHEEALVSPLWGNRLTPETAVALKQKKLLPVLQLDSGFVRPEYPGQVLVSYYQAGRMCDYIAGRWGEAALLGMLHSYAAHKTTAEVMQENLHETSETFDKDFSAWLAQQTGEVVAHLSQWKDGMAAASSDLHSGNSSAALAKALAIRDFFPGNPATYELIAQCYSMQQKKPEAMEALEQYRKAGGSAVDLLSQLAQLQIETNHPEAAIGTLQQINLIFPEEQKHHQTLGALLLKANRPADAIVEYRSVLALKPADVAESHLDLARALNAAHQTAEAKDQVLLALEAAPNYKPAQQLLLQLSQ